MIKYFPFTSLTSSPPLSLSPCSSPTQELDFTICRPSFRYVSFNVEPSLGESACLFVWKIDLIPEKLWNNQTIGDHKVFWTGGTGIFNYWRCAFKFWRIWSFHFTLSCRSVLATMAQIEVSGWIDLIKLRATQLQPLRAAWVRPTHLLADHPISSDLWT